MVLLSFILVVGCKQEAPKTPSPPTKLAIPTFNADSTYAYIVEQLAFGPRYPGSAGHADLQSWIISKMENFGAEVITQEFTASFKDKKNVPSKNIMAQINPQYAKRILLAAHYDSRIVAEKDDERQNEPIPGADDGASGVAMLVEIARMLQEHPIGIGVDLLFFDAEDQGNNTDDKTWALGSQYWSKNPVPRGYDAKYGILLDMVGAKDATFGKEGVSRRYARDLQDKIWALAASMGYSDFFQDIIMGGVNDDHFYVNRDAGIPMVDIIHQSVTDRSSFGHYHHTHDDDIDIISKRTLKVVGQVVTAVLFNESNGTFR